MTNKNDLKKEVSMWDRRLQLLKEKKARLGYSADPSVDTEIEEIEAKLIELQAELREIGDIEDIPASIDGFSSRKRQYQIAFYWATDGRKANLSRFDLSGTDLRTVDLVRANLSLANLSKSDLRMADLSGADLRMADLSGADLRQAILLHSDLTRANLVGANLSEAILQEANLTEANLVGANLSEAILQEANLTEANLIGANLNGTTLTMSRLREIKYDRTTTWPTYYKLQRAFFNPVTLLGSIFGFFVGICVDEGIVEMAIGGILGMIVVVIVSFLLDRH